MHQIYMPPPFQEIGLRNLGQARRPSVARISRGHEPHGQLRYLWTDQLPATLLANDAFETPCPPVDLFAIAEVEMRSDWMPYVDGGVIADEAIFPTYVRDYYKSGHIDLFGYPEVARTRRIAAPAFVVTHFNMRTYGHFLLEVLPKLLLIRELYRLGLTYRVVFPGSMRSFLPMVRTACPEIRLLIYDDLREKLSLKLALLPSMMVSLSSHFHDVFTSTLKLLGLHCSAGPAPQKRIFLSREGLRSFRTLRNEQELAAVAREHGFDIIRPQTMPWAEQVRLFNSATHVIGEFSSALHNTMFSPPTTNVVCLNWLGPVQSAIAASVGHRIGYIMPSEPVEITFKNGWTETQYFEVDPDHLRSRLDHLG